MAALLAIYGLQEIAFRPAYQVGLRHYLPEAEFGRGYSLVLMGMNLGGTALWLACGAIGALALLGFIYLWARARRALPEAAE